MIKVGIAGAETQLSGELLRLLVHHPEVEISTLYAPALKGRKVSNFHKGLTGEIDLRFSDKVDVSELDILFLNPGSLPNLTSIPEDLRIVTLRHTDNLNLIEPYESIDYVTGLSEMFRKPLVRGAKAAHIPSPPVSIAMIALFPLASHLLLNDKVKLKFLLPAVLKDKFSKESISDEIETLIKGVQLSFTKINDIEIGFSNSLRALKMELEFPCGITETEIEKIYNDIYDDHNFTFLTRTAPDPTEVAGTQKCLLCISKPSEDVLNISAIADGILRGGAGDAVHVMNLLFGLFEKTGLNLQASLAFKSPTAL